MRVFGFLGGVFDKVNPWFLAAAAAACLAAEFILARKLRRAGVFLATAVVTDGICFLLALLSARFSDADTAVFGVLLAVVTSLLASVYQIADVISEKRRIRREKRAEENRRSVFTLPERENTFVRDRLNTTLRPEEGEEGEYGMEDGKLRLDHVRKMLLKLKTAELSPGDRLEAEGISRLITLYATKDLLSPKEVRDLNDCLAAVLKMTAKYAL